MQPNVVQSPQAATAQSSIVQPPPTPTLPASEQTEIQTPNQEPFAVSKTILLFFIYFGKMCMCYLGNLLFGCGHWFGVLDKILVAGLLYLLLLLNPTKVYNTSTMQILVNV